MRYVLTKLLFCVICCQLDASEKILLICGPSGVGKSTVIQALKEMDSRFQYITPYTTRPLREGEKDKTQIPYEEILAMKAAGKLIALNEVHGNYYATPKTLIEEAFLEGRFPVIDWPIQQVSLMRTTFKGDVITVYLYPESLAQLQQQLALDQRDVDGIRFAAGEAELSDFFLGRFNSLIDLELKNTDVTALAEQIYAFYVQSCCSMHSANQ